MLFESVPIFRSPSERGWPDPSLVASSSGRGGARSSLCFGLPTHEANVSVLGCSAVEEWLEGGAHIDIRTGQTNTKYMRHVVPLTASSGCQGATRGKKSPHHRNRLRTDILGNPPEWMVVKGRW